MALQMLRLEKHQCSVLYVEKISCSARCSFEELEKVKDTDFLNFLKRTHIVSVLLFGLWRYFCLYFASFHSFPSTAFVSMPVYA